MKRIATTASALTLMMLLSGAALAGHHEEGEGMAEPSGVDSANEVGEMSDHGAKLDDGAIAEEGGVDSANELAQDTDATLDDDELAEDSGVDSAN